MTAAQFSPGRHTSQVGPNFKCGAFPNIYLPKHELRVFTKLDLIGNVWDRM